MLEDDFVIIIAKPKDVHALSVAAEIETAMDRRAVILDSADYPKAWSITHSVQSGSGQAWKIRGPDWELASDRLNGVWWRRPRKHRIAPEVKGRKERRFCLDEARSAFQGWLHAMGRKVINPLASESAANQKPFQLVKGAEAGLRIPRTTITNDPREARRFLESLEGPAIFKVLTGTSWQFTETRRFDDEYFRYLEDLKYSPVIFQELIEAARDIRATVVDRQVFPVSIRPNNPEARLDWRMDLAAEIQPHALPEETKRVLVELVHAMGLRFGAIDLRLTPNGEYVFLEINPGGQFLFCEIHAGQLISRALAEALVNGPPR